MVNFDPKKLKELRIQKSVSVTEMAEKLGVSVQQAHRLEKGERRLTVDMLLAFCNELDVDVSHLFSQPAEVPITGIINELYEVLACPPNTPRVCVAWAGTGSSPRPATASSSGGAATSSATLVAALQSFRTQGLPFPYDLDQASSLLHPHSPVLWTTPPC